MRRLRPGVIKRFALQNLDGNPHGCGPESTVRSRPLHLLLHSLCPHLLTRSFIRSWVCSFTPSPTSVTWSQFLLTHSYIHSFTYLFMHLLIHSLTIHVLTQQSNPWPNLLVPTLPRQWTVGIISRSMVKGLRVHWGCRQVSVALAPTKEEWLMLKSWWWELTGYKSVALKTLFLSLFKTFHL